MDEPMTDKQAEVYRLTVVNRLTQNEIAGRLGITQQSVQELLAAAKAKLRPVDPTELRAQSLELHMATQKAALALAEMMGAPVTSGKDGMIVYDTDGNVVRDYSLRVQALDLARKADIEIRKLHGLDAASKTEVTGSIRYEVVGLSEDELP